MNLKDKNITYLKNCILCGNANLERVIQISELYISSTFVKSNDDNDLTKFKTPFLGELPIDKKLRINSDTGHPICITEPESETSKMYLSIAKKIHQNKLN